jgi:hypothetical protein
MDKCWNLYSKSVVLTEAELELRGTMINQIKRADVDKINILHHTSFEHFYLMHKLGFINAKSNSNIVRAAATLPNKLLKFLLHHDYKRDSKAMLSAVQADLMANVWLLLSDSPKSVHPSILKYAIEKNSIQMFTDAWKLMGHQVKQLLDLRVLAAAKGNARLVEFFHKNGAPLNTKMLLAAIETLELDVVKYLLFNDCPIPYDIDQLKLFDRIDRKSVQIANIVCGYRMVKLATYTKDETCSICLDHFDENPAYKLPCSSLHVFHRTCILLWLTNHNTCPTCRFSF